MEFARDVVSERVVDVIWAQFWKEGRKPLSFPIEMWSKRGHVKYKTLTMRIQVLDCSETEPLGR